MSAPTLPDFLLARYAEDEAAAKAVPPALGNLDPFSLRFDSWESDHSKEDSRFVDRFNPARVLAEVEAKRQIVEQYRAAYADDEQEDDTERGWITAGVEAALAQTLGHLALPYADHPDYDEAWRP